MTAIRLDLSEVFRNHSFNDAEVRIVEQKIETLVSEAIDASKQELKEYLMESFVSQKEAAAKDLAIVKAINEMKFELTQEISSVRTELRTEIASVRTELANVQVNIHKTLWKAAGMSVGFVSALLAFLKYAS